MTLQTPLSASDQRLRPPSPLPPPDGADRVPPPPFTGYVHLFDRPGRTCLIDPPTVYQRDILESSGTWSSPDVWEVEVRYIRPMHPGATS